MRKRGDFYSSVLANPIFQRITKGLVFSLMASLLSIPIAVITAPIANAADCTYGVQTVSSNIYFEPSHGKVFYVDAPDVMASFIGYKIGNKTGSTIKNYWVKISSFTTSASAAITLSNGASSAKYQIASVSNGETQTAYFQLKSSADPGSRDVVANQSHLVQVFDDDPDKSGVTPLFDCTYKFTRVTSVIEANANKVESISMVHKGTTYTSANASSLQPNIGDTVTVSLSGNTGTIGAGDGAGDGSVIWLTPSANPNFNNSAVRLEKSTIDFSSGTCTRSFVNQLLIKNADTCGYSGTYTARYVFRILASSSSAITFTPIANIASGTQIKHTAIASTGTISLTLSSATSKISLTKQVIDSAGVVYSSGVGNFESTTVFGTDYLIVRYRITATSSDNGIYQMDNLVDSATSSAVFDSRTVVSPVQYQDAANSDSVTITGIKKSGDLKTYFNGPFQVSNGSSKLILEYVMLIPQVAGTFENQIWGFVGGTQITASGSIPGLRLTSGGTSISGITDASTSAPPIATTEAATNVSSKSATFNGSVDTSTSLLNVNFQYGTSSTLATYDSVTVASPGLSNAFSKSGLTPGITYYFRIVANYSTPYTATGDILSFTLKDVEATTEDATGVTSNSANLNGSVVLNDTSTAITFTYSSTADFSSDTTTVTYSANTKTATSVTYAITGLTGNTTYYFKITADPINEGAASATGLTKQFTTGASSSAVVPPGCVAPTITVITPNYGSSAGGTRITIAGSGLTASIAIGGRSVEIRTSSSSQIVLLAPAGTRGRTTLVMESCAGSITREFWYDPEPLVTNVSQDLVCVIGSQIVLTGRYLEGARASIGTSPATVISSSENSLTLKLPSGFSGDQVLAVTTAYGQANVRVRYVLNPEFASVTLPYLHVGGDFNLKFAAANALSYSIRGEVPSGMNFNDITGSLIGIPTRDGVYRLTIIARGSCGETELVQILDIDKETPNAISHRINFPNGSACMSESAKSSLEAFLERVKSISPRNIDPQIYFSGPASVVDFGLPISAEDDARYQCICEILQGEGIEGQIFTGVFEGAQNRIEIIVSWVRP